jgi:hypothetical protein
LAAFTSRAAAPAAEVTYLDQGWTPDQRARYYWGSQGSALISYDIYLALDLVGTSERFNSRRVSDSFGLLVDPPNAQYNPDDLPIGLTKTVVSSGQFAGTYMGMTCAACHTGQIQHQGQQIRIDGGVANRFDLVRWIRTLSESLDATLAEPTRFEALAGRIRATQPRLDTAELQRRLWTDAGIVSAQVKHSMIVPFLPGPGRVDALGSIHNTMFAIATGRLENARPTLAPVKPPFLWNAPQSAWVQWSGVAANPIRRNFFESLGVFVRHDLQSASPATGLFESTADLRGQFELERLLRQLAPPRWPEELLGRLDADKVARGQKLFVENCQSCHSTYPYRWSADRAPGKSYLENAMVPQRYVGTDRTQLDGVTFEPEPVLATGQLAPYLGSRAKASSADLNQVIGNELLKRAVASMRPPLSPEETADLSNFEDLLQTRPVPVDSYKAAPRDGVWATGPFLHNGSVPNLYELLSPVAERSRTFRLTREFDPHKVGLQTAAAGEDGYLFDTSRKGNSNQGHAFEGGRDAVRTAGVIGRGLAPDERYAIIEYLKSIPATAGQVTPHGGPAQPLRAREDPTWFNTRRPYEPAAR